MLSEVSAVPAAELPIGALRDHLRLGTGFADDALQDGVLEAALRGAIDAVEARTGLALIERAFELRLRRWSAPDGAPLPVRPIARLKAVEVIDAVETVIPLEAGRVLVTAGPGGQPVLAATSGDLPTIPRGGAIVIHLAAGFGSWGMVPPALRQAVMMLAAFFYEDRGTLGGEGVPPAVTALIAPWRMLRLSVGGTR